MSTNTIAKHSLKTTTLYHVITNNSNTIMFVFYFSVCILYNYWAINYISNYFDSTTFDSYKLSLNTSSQLRYNKTEIQNEFLTTKYLKIVHPNEFNDLNLIFNEYEYYNALCIVINSITLIFGYLSNKYIDDSHDYFIVYMFNQIIKSLIGGKVMYNCTKIFNKYDKTILYPELGFYNIEGITVFSSGITLAMITFVLVSIILIGLFEFTKLIWDELIKCAKNTKIEYVETKYKTIRELAEDL